MYDERRETFSFRSFFLTLLLLVLFILLMLFLFPTRWEFKKSCNGTKSVVDDKTIQVIYDEIYTNNINRMKEAARGYYTADKLPKNVNGTSKLTLGEMHDKHLILKVKDKNGKECDKNKSYAEVTKYSDGYKLKVNLSCGTQDNYIVVNLSDYSTCASNTCNTQTNNKTTNTSKDNTTTNTTTKTNTTTNTNTTTKTNTTTNTKVAVTGITASKTAITLKVGESEKINVTVLPSNASNTNTVWSNSNNAVVTLNNRVVVAKAAGTSTITVKTADGGKTVTIKVTVISDKKQETNTNTNTNTNTGTKTNTNTNTNTNTGTKTNTTPTTTYKCKYVDGKYYDSTGKVVTKDAYNKSCNVVINYEYKLTVPAKTTYSNWSSWQTTAISKTSTREVETKTETVKVTTIEKRTVIEKVTEPYTYTETIKEPQTKQVQIGTENIYEPREVQVGTIDVVRTGKSSVPPHDCCNKTYRNIQHDGKGTYTWEEVTKEPVYKIVNVVVGTKPIYKTVTEMVEKQVTKTGTRTVDKPKTVEVPVETTKKVTYYRYRTVTTTPAQTYTKWSTSKNDTTLLNQGYKLTGVTK